MPSKSSVVCFTVILAFITASCAFESALSKSGGVWRTEGVLPAETKAVKLVPRKGCELWASARTACLRLEEEIAAYHDVTIVPEGSEESTCCELIVASEAGGRFFVAFRLPDGTTTWTAASSRGSAYGTESELVRSLARLLVASLADSRSDMHFSKSREMPSHVSLASLR